VCVYFSLSPLRREEEFQSVAVCGRFMGSFEREQQKSLVVFGGVFTNGHPLTPPLLVEKNHPGLFSFPKGGVLTPPPGGLLFPPILVGEKKGGPPSFLWGPPPPIFGAPPLLFGAPLWEHTLCAPQPEGPFPK